MWTLIHEGILPTLGAVEVEEDEGEEEAGEGPAANGNSSDIYKTNEILTVWRFLVKCDRA